MKKDTNLISKIMTSPVTVRAPATTSNLGPGFDCLGMALDIWNSVRVETGKAEILINGEGQDNLSADQNNLVYQCFNIPFLRTGKPIPEVKIFCDNKIPIARGLGSSSAASLCGLMAGNEMCGRPLSKKDILETLTEIEGHPDNVFPGLLGGFQVVARDGSQYVNSTIPISETLHAIIFVPDMPMLTQQARSVLNSSVSRDDAVYNLGRVGLLVSAFATGKLDNLKTATQDRLHQSARESIFPAIKVILRAALDAGALGAFLSGGGSSLLALADEKEMTIGYEMAEAASKAGIQGEVKITRPSNQGAHLVGLP